jgi:hypothetical protein
MIQRIEFGRRDQAQAVGLLLPGVLLVLLLGGLAALAAVPVDAGFRIEWGGWLVLALDVQLACTWFWNRARRCRGS